MPMTEQDWRTCQNSPAKMLKFVEARSSPRKLRLFTCALARLLWTEQWDDSGLQAVQAAEAFADGALGDQDLKAALSKVAVGSKRDPWPSWIVRQTCLAQARYAAWSVNADCNLSMPMPLRPKLRTDLLRCIFWPVQFTPVSVPGSWLSWRDRTIPNLAQAAYDERDLPSGHLEAGRLAVLADALEEAGCTNADTLAHLRGPGPHVRGCWVIDLLLGKE